MSKKMTHEGWIMRPAGRRAYLTQFRETKLYWVDSDGHRYKKGTGCCQCPEEWNQWCLELDSIKPIQGEA